MISITQYDLVVQYRHLSYDVSYQYCVRQCEELTLDSRNIVDKWWTGFPVVGPTTTSQTHLGLFCSIINHFWNIFACKIENYANIIEK